MISPTRIDAPTDRISVSHSGSPTRFISTRMKYTPRVMMSPWAKLISFRMPYTIE